MQAVENNKRGERMEGLKISYGSAYELVELLKKHPEEIGKYHKLYTQAQKKVDDLTMQLEITTAEIIKEICEERNVPPSAKQEVRRAEVQLDKRWQILTKRLNLAKMKTGILYGRLQGLYTRRAMFDKISNFEQKWMYAGIPIYKDKRNMETKQENAIDGAHLPEED